jgi:hypothetical protein
LHLCSYLLLVVVGHSTNRFCLQYYDERVAVSGQSPWIFLFGATETSGRQFVEKSFLISLERHWLACPQGRLPRSVCVEPD